MPLNPSDIVRELPLGTGVSVIGSHPEGLVALEKPCRILSHPNVEADRRRSLLTASWSTDRERYAWRVDDKLYRFFLLHRLDSATSGVLLGCLNPNMARELKLQFSKRRVAKSYRAIVSGIAKDKDTRWQDLLRKRTKGSRVRVQASSRGGRPVETRVSAVENKFSAPKLSLIKLNPRTGRTHQLRVQCAQRRHPIIGDTTYGDFPLNREIQKHLGVQRLFLHASKIRIRWQWKGRDHVFEAESKIPDVFGDLMRLEY